MAEQASPSGQSAEDRSLSETGSAGKADAVQLEGGDQGAADTGEVEPGLSPEPQDDTLHSLYEVQPKNLMSLQFHAAFSKAIHKGSNALHGIKAIRKSNLRDAQAVRELLEESKKFKHPNLIRVLRVLEDHLYIYVVMPLCSGGSLFDRIIAKGIMGQGGVAIYMKQIFSALHYLHANHQICHRDVRPENILFLNSTDTAPLQLVQLTLASQCQLGRKCMKTRVGTPFYVAPEVLLGHYSEKCDLWSAGVIMHTLLVGYPPFQGDDDQSTIRKVRRGEFSITGPDWTDIAASCKDLLKAVLVRDPESRMQIDHILEHEWFKNNIFVPDNTLPLTPRAFNKAAMQHVLHNLQVFHGAIRAKHQAINLMAQCCTEPMLKTLKSEWSKLDNNGDGTLTIKQVHASFGEKENIAPIVAEALQKWMEAAKEEAKVDYSELLTNVLARRGYVQEDICWSVFRQFDKNVEGKMNPHNLDAFLSAEPIKQIQTGTVPASIAQDFGGTEKPLNFQDLLHFVTQGSMSKGGGGGGHHDDY